MLVTQPVPAKYIRMIRKAFPKAEEVIGPHNVEVWGHTINTTDVYDGVILEMDRKADISDKLWRQASSSRDMAEYFIVEKFESQQKRDQRLESIRKTWKDLRCPKIKDKFDTSGSGSVRYYPPAFTTDGSKQMNVKVLDDTSLAIRRTHHHVPGRLHNHLVQSDKVKSLLKACEDPATEKLPIHNDEDLKDLREAAQLAVLQGKPELVARLMTLTGKTPSLTQQNKLIRLAACIIRPRDKDRSLTELDKLIKLATSKSKEDKQTLKNLFMDEALRRFRAPSEEGLKGAALAKALVQMSSGGVPKGPELATFLENSANFTRVQTWINPPVWKEYLASLQDAKKS